MSLLKYKYQDNLHQFLLQVRILILMFAHLHVTRGNESIFQFKVYGSVSYPRKYCNIYGSILPATGTSWDHPGYPGYLVSWDSILPTTGTSWDHARMRSQLGHPGIMLGCVPYSTIETSWDHARLLGCVPYSTIGTSWDHARMCSILHYWDHPRMCSILHYWDILGSS